MGKNFHMQQLRFQIVISKNLNLFSMNRRALDFCWGSLFLVLFLACKTLAKHGTSTNGTDSSLVETRKCNNVYFYEASNKKIENLLQEMNGRLLKLQHDMHMLIGNKTVQTRKLWTVKFVGNLSFHFVCVLRIHVAN